MKQIFFKVLLECLFWFTRQRWRISWTCGTGHKQCKFRQKIKWIGLENCRINNMRLKRRLRNTYSCPEPFFHDQSQACKPTSISSSLQIVGHQFWADKWRWRHQNRIWGGNICRQWPCLGMGTLIRGGNWAGHAYGGQCNT